jgi:F-type H+-transporting ATPase subunit delta
MRDFLVADRYARSLDRLVPDNDAAREMASALKDLAEIYTASHDLRNTLSNPALPEAGRLAVLDAVCDRCGAPDLVRKLVSAMLRRRRIELIPPVAVLFSAKTDLRLDRVRAEVTSAAPLSEARQDDIRQTLARYTGKNVRVEFAIDPALLGGIVARIQDRVLDGSIRSRIKRLKNHLLPEENLGG